MGAPKCSCDTYNSAGFKNCCSTAGQLTLDLNRIKAERDRLAAELAHTKEVEFPRKVESVAEGWRKKCDRLAAENEQLRYALENCRLLAARKRKEDWALLILGFCAEGGVVGSVTR